jgi:DNA polymerase I-like protein with 3'-5' exonuclease and polymerase domains
MTTASRNGFPHNARYAAELYLAKGLAPIPLPPRSKNPGYADWENLRLTPDALDDYFPPQQARNVGVLNGAPSGNHHDVDLDCPEALRAAPRLLPETGWVFGRASTPGAHRIYRTERPLDAAQERYEDLDGAVLIELRGTGGHTIYPPSHHKETGEAVAWERFAEPAELDLAALQRAVRGVAAAALLARHWPSKGSRDKAAMALAGGLTRGGWATERTSNFCLAVAEAAGDEEARMRASKAGPTAQKQETDQKTTGWPTLAKLVGDEVVRRVQQWLGITLTLNPSDAKAVGGPKKKAPIRPPAPYRPFPTEGLPQPLRSFVEQAAGALGCDVSFLALPALSVVAALIGNARSIRLKRDWYEPSVVWTGIVGDSGTLKSPAVNAVVGPLYRLQKELIKKFKTDLEEYQRQKAAYDERKKKAKRADKPFDEEEPERPSLARVVTGDVTIEKLAQLLEDNPKGLLVSRDELGGWLGSFQRYKGKGGGSDLPNWLELSRAGTIQVDRKTGDRPTLFIQHAAVSVTGGIQPGPLARALTAEHVEAGLGARILMAMPPKRRKEWTELEIAPEVREAYEKLLHQLRDLQLDKTGDGEREPFGVRLTPEGKEAWVRFYQEWAAAQAAVEGELAAAYAKLEGYAARLALIHHVVSRVGALEDCQPIEPASIEAGAALARWFAYEARRIYAALAEPEDARHTRRLIEFIGQYGGRMTGRRLHLSNKSRYPDAEAAEVALAALVDAGLAEWTDAAPGPKGGRPTRTLILKPDTTCFKSYETPGDEDEDGEEDGGGDATIPPTKPPAPCGNPAENNGFVASVACSTTHSPPTMDSPDPLDRKDGDDARREVSEYGPNERGGPAASATPLPTGGGALYVTDADQLSMAAAAVEESAVIGLDVETTGLNPRTQRVRLLSLDCDTTDGGRFTYLIDCFAVGPSPLWGALAGKPLVIHNAAFDLSFLRPLGLVPGGPVHDTMLLARLLAAGTFDDCDLAAVVQRELGRALDKTKQRSDWTGPLSEAQLHYAALDAAVLVPLYEALSPKIKAAALEQAAQIERRCLPAVAWLAAQGVSFDRERWETLAAAAQTEAQRLAAALDALAPLKPDSLAFAPWNWGSPQQVKEAFALAGIDLDKTDDDVLAALDHPLAAHLRQYRDATKRCTTYGRDWLKHVAADGRAYSHWKQYGARTGRMASGDPNMQNVPRDPAYRQCFHAGPGRVLVKADYSQIELRIAAKVANETRMIEAYRRGDDLHVLTAQRMTGKRDVTKQERQVAKPVNFGLIYGLGAPSLCRKAKTDYGLDLSEEDARRYRHAFFAAYPGIGTWHNRIKRQMATETRTLAGRRVLVDAEAFFGAKANYVVQGTGGDGIKLALALLWERRDQCPDAFPVLVVHDEIVVEADAGQADAVAAWLKAAMVDAMAPLIEPVPVAVEVKIGRTWGGE